MNWTITADPYYIIYGKLRLVADLGPLSAQKGDEKIVIEVKSFLNPSFIYDLDLERARNLLSYQR